MSLQPGQMLSHYRVAEKIGEGGMGVVWRALDTTLDREVAIKLLPPELSGEPDRLARFDREAKLLAALNHTTIAGIYGLHEDAGIRFIAMELVPGEDLSQVIARGALPPEKAMELALQVADALEVAHERGVIHRDLKPANIKITPDAQVKVLDFGLAKAFEAEPGTSSVSLTMSPTITSAGTVAGVILGTAAYMAPEQARGQAVDKRADIWAFGCVLYEMLTGKRPFSGETISDTMASVLKLDPDWRALPATTPASLRRLLRRCLEKDHRKRLRDIGEARIDIQRTLSGEVDEPVPAVAASGSAPTASRASRLPWVVAAVAVLAAVAGWVLPEWLPSAPAESVLRFELDVAEKLDFSQPGSSMVLSPDGQRIAYLAGDPISLYVRRINQFSGLALTGTEGASQPFFSPDGEWLGFFSNSQLKKVSIFGGASVTLAEVRTHRGGSWSEDGTIIYAPGVVNGLYRIRETGGEPEQLTNLNAEENNIRSHRWPCVLPGGKAVLFTVQPQGTNFDNARIEVLDLETKQRRIIANGGSFGRYASTGHVTYIHEGTLFAVPFDPKTLETRGTPVPVVEEVSSDNRNGGGNIDYSPQGHLVYLAGSAISSQLSVAWVEGDSSLVPVLEELRNYTAPRLSPDGSRLALSFSTSAQDDVWVYDFDRGAMSRLTFEDVADIVPIWTPDGNSIVFSSQRDANVLNLFIKPADGAGSAEPLLISDYRKFANDMSHDGKYLLFSEENAATNWDQKVLNMDDRTVEVFLQTRFEEGHGQFSPDGRWVAYDSDESGSYQTYVRPFPASEGKWQVSTDGGGNPLWGPDGKTLYYVSGESQLMAVDYTASDQTFRPERPRVVIEKGLQASRILSYDIASDGRVITTVDEGLLSEDPVRARVVLNWFQELAQRTP